MANQKAVTDRGLWSSTDHYNQHDMANDGTLSYIALAANTNVALTTTATWFPIGGGGGGGGAFTQITDSLLGSDAATFTFSSIPGTFNHLRLIVQARSATASSDDPVVVQLNADTAAHYQWQYLYTFGTGTPSGGGSGGVATASPQIAAISADSSNAGLASTFDTLFPNYASTTFHKVWHGVGADWQTQSVNSFQPQIHIGHWESTAAITGIVLTLLSGANFRTGSRATLYGLT